MANQTKAKKTNKKGKNSRMKRVIMGTLSAVFMISAIIIALVPTPESKAADNYGMPDADDLKNAMVSEATAHPERQIPNYADTNQLANYPVYASNDGRFRVAYGMDQSTSDKVGIIVFYNKDLPITNSTVDVPSEIAAFRYDYKTEKYIAVSDNPNRQPLYYVSREMQAPVYDASGNEIAPAIDREIKLCVGAEYDVWKDKQLYTSLTMGSEGYKRDEYGIITQTYIEKYDSQLVSNNSAPSLSSAEWNPGTQLNIPVKYVGSYRYIPTNGKAEYDRDETAGQYAYYGQPLRDSTGEIVKDANGNGITLPIDGVGPYKPDGNYVEGVFEGMNAFATLRITDDILAVGERAFAKCQMAGVDMGAHLKCIGNYAFYGCNRLTAFTFTDPTNLEEIGDYAFSECAVLRSIEVPDQVITLGNYCFKDCSSLEAISIDSGKSDGYTALDIVGSGLFYNCGNLREVKFPKNVTNIDEVQYTCFYCKQLTYLGLPESSTGVFQSNNVKGCNSLDTVYCPSLNLELYCNNLSDAPHDHGSVSVSSNTLEPICIFSKENLGFGYALPEQYEVSDQFCIEAYKNSKAYEYAMAHNLSFGYLDKTNLGEYERKVDGCIFTVNENNELIRFVVAEGDGRNIIIPDNIAKYKVVSIDATTFSGNEDVTFLYIPASVRTIATNAFKDCTDLQTVYFENALTIETIGEDAFKTNMSNGSIVTEQKRLNFIGEISSASVPYQYAIDYRNNFNAESAPVTYIRYCSQFPENLQIEVNPVRDPNTQMIISATPVLKEVPKYEQMLSENYSISAYGGTSKYVRTKEQENEIVRLAKEKYDYNRSNPNSLRAYTEEEQRVIDAVFHVYVPDGVIALADDLFEGNNYVESVILETVKSIPDNEFENCKALAYFEMRSGDYIGTEAFKNCDNLTRVILPATVTGLGEVPFIDCDNLTSVDFSNSPYFVCSDGIIYSLDEQGNHAVIQEGLVTRGRTSGTAVGPSKLGPDEFAGVTGIKPRAFQNCDGIKGVDLTASQADEIPDYCFDNATNLSTCFLPETVNRIGEYAFRNTSLYEITVKNRMIVIADNAFVKGDPSVSGNEGDGNYIQDLTIYAPEGSTLDRYVQGKPFTLKTELPIYTVTYIDWDDKVLMRDSVKEGDFVDSPIPTRAGYAFVGWTENRDAARPYIFDTTALPITKDLMLYALYEIDDAPSIPGYFSVTFRDFDDLMTWDVQYVEPDGYPTATTATPMRTGYIFAGWSPSNYTGIKVTGNLVVKANYVVDPNYVPGQDPNDKPAGVDPTTGKKIYEVTFVDYDGTVLDTQRVLEGDCPAETTVVPTRKGYTFTTWSPSNYATTPVTSNLTVTALYQQDGSQGGAPNGNGSIIGDDNNPNTEGNGSGNQGNGSGNQGNGSGNGGGNGNNVVNGGSQNANSSGGGTVNGGSISGNSSGTKKPQNGTKVEVTKSGISNKDLVTATVAGSNDNFVIKISDSDDARAAVEAALLKEYGSLDNLKYFAMDISLYDSTGTSKIQNTAGVSVTITMPIPDALAGYAGNNKAGAVNNGLLEKLGARFVTIDNVPCISFVATHFSPYTVYVETNNLTASVTDAAPKTGDPIHPKWFLSIGLALLSILMFLGKGSKNRIVKVIE